MLIITYFFVSSWEQSSHAHWKQVAHKLLWSLLPHLVLVSLYNFIFLPLLCLYKHSVNRKRNQNKNATMHDFFPSSRPGPKCTKLQVWKHPEATRHKKVIFHAARGHWSPQFTVNKLLLWQQRFTTILACVMTWLKTKREKHTNANILWDQVE